MGEFGDGHVLMFESKGAPDGLLRDFYIVWPALRHIALFEHRLDQATELASRSVLELQPAFVNQAVLSQRVCVMHIVSAWIVKQCRDLMGGGDGAVSGGQHGFALGSLARLKRLMNKSPEIEIKMTGSNVKIKVTIPAPA